MDFKERVKRILEGLPQKVKIINRYVGPGEPVYIIAEIGINHNGDVAIAKRLITEAAAAGVDAVKFQKRTPEEVLTKEGLLRPYNSPHAFAPTYGEHRKKLEFGEAEYQELIKFAKEKNVAFFASVWDSSSTDFMERLGIGAYKIPSADVINLPLLEYVAKKGKPVLLSTGMSTIDEVDQAVETILQHNSRLLVMQCVSLYPSTDDKIDLLAMDLLKERYHPLPIGYSGHEIDMLPTLAAVARGATAIERHFTLDKTMKGSDHSASLEPAQLKELVSSVKRIEKILGKRKKVLYSEIIPMREKLAKSIVAKTFIPRGTRLRLEMLTVKGPGTGLKPSLMRDVVGKQVMKDIEADTILTRDVFEV